VVNHDRRAESGWRKPVKTSRINHLVVNETSKGKITPRGWYMLLCIVVTKPESGVEFGVEA
jgi:hypothetical protein